MSRELQIESEHLLIYRQDQNEEWPLDSIKLTNRMPFRIPSGPLTLFDDLGDAGEAMLPTLASNVDQWIHYAVNGEVKIKKSAKSESLKSLSIEFNENLHTIKVHKTFQSDVSYDIEDRGSKMKTVLIEHPKSSDGSMVLDHPSFDHESEGRLCYRLSTVPTETVKLLVRSEKVVSEPLRFYPLNRKAVEEWQNAATLSDFRAWQTGGPPHVE